MAAERTSDFGVKLREARQRHGMTLREIANATKISVSILEALERSDISRLPGGIFSRAFVRSYAVEVGLDPEEAVGDFVRQFPHDSVTAGHPPSSRFDHDEVGDDSRVASTALRIVMLSVPIACAVLYVGFKGRPAATVSEPPVALSATDGRTGSPAVVTPAERTSGTVERLSVEIVAHRPCTVSASADGESPVILQLNASERRVFDVRRELTLTVSDPAAIEWSINGKPARPFGNPAATATTHVTLDNYETHLDR